MGRKLHRYRKRGFRKQYTWLRGVLWGLLCVAIVGAGFFGARLLDRQPDAQPPDSSATSEPTPSDPQPKPTEPSKPADTQPEEERTLRAFYLPMTALRDSATLSDTLSRAAKAGFTALLFDLKDSEGKLYYHSACPAAQMVNSTTADAFTAQELGQLFATVKQAGLQPIPRLFAFRDHLGAKGLPAARIGLASNPGWTWYDGNPQNGGRAWLNPYADEAHSYIISLAQELREAGAAAILLDGVQFPHQISSATFGNSSNTNLSRSEVLTLFVDKVKAALGDDCPVILGCTGLSALGNETQVYGGNPLTFAPTVAAPAIEPTSLPGSIPIGETAITNTPAAPQETVQAMVAQMILRTKVMEEERRPTILPRLQAAGYSPAQINQEIAGCIAAGCRDFIVYHPDGTYDFTALQLP